MSAAAKYPDGVSNRPPGHHRPLSLLERITLAHVGALVIFAAWAFGGNTEWSRTALSWWGSFGLLITLTAIRDPEAWKHGRLRPLRWLWPLALFNAVVVISSFNPNFRAVANGAETLFVEMLAPALRLPSSARPELSLQALWFFDAAYLSCFNLALVVRQRRALRALLLAIVGNAVLLAVFGTLQRLLGAPGPFFGLMITKQAHFFSSFIYHNHWGAFTVLMIAISLGLVFHFARRRDARDFWHSPAFGGLVAVALLAATVPLSTSRSCTVLVAVLFGGALVHFLIRVIRRRRAYQESVALPLAGALLAVGVAGAFAYDLSRDVIRLRVENTLDQVAGMRERGETVPRQILYRDTWRMAREKIWFGWGMASYPTAFYNRNTQHYSAVDHLPHLYHDAHSDWLQSLSEVGIVGTSLLALCALVPLWHRRRVLAESPLVAYLLAGCTLIVLYSALEFPFGNRAVVIVFWTCFFCAIHYGRLDASSDSAA